MHSTRETQALLDELVERSQMVVDLDGPQIEAWASGLFPVLIELDSDGESGLEQFALRCVDAGDPPSALVVQALAELTLDESAALNDAAAQLNSVAPENGAQIGASRLAHAWTVRAPFGRSIVLGFENDVVLEDFADTDHCVLIEVGDDGAIEDLQLAGAAEPLLEEARQADDRVEVSVLALDDALDQAVAGWPGVDTSEDQLGPGFAANQHFVRSRIANAGGAVLPAILATNAEVDIRRGLDDAGFAEANRAALSTLRAAIRDLDDLDLSASDEQVQAWVAVIRGDVDGVSGREREGLLWLEWADWLGAGIGLHRAGSGTEVTGASLVDHVNRCPEVSSTIDKRDRDYAEWAFDVAIDVLADADVIQAGALTESGGQSLVAAMIEAWG